MNALEKLFPHDLYHSYIVEGDVDALVPLLEDFVMARFYTTAHPDILSQRYDVFTMGDSSLIKEWHNNRGGTTTKSVCIIGTQFINYDAEQTLLKILEEPKDNTHFFVVIPNADALLATIRSRAHIVSIATPDTEDTYKEAVAFIKASKAERIDMVGELIDANTDTDNSGKLRFAAISLLSNVEACLYKKFTDDTDKEKYVFVLEQLHKNREYLERPGASVKMILEHIALVL